MNRESEFDDTAPLALRPSTLYRILTSRPLCTHYMPLGTVLPFENDAATIRSIAEQFVAERNATEPPTTYPSFQELVADFARYLFLPRSGPLPPRCRPTCSRKKIAKAKARHTALRDAIQMERLRKQALSSTAIAATLTDPEIYPPQDQTTTTFTHRPIPAPQPILSGREEYNRSPACESPITDDDARDYFGLPRFSDEVIAALERTCE